MVRNSEVALFFCTCCERKLPINRRSTARLVTPTHVERLLCIQCEKFLSGGLPFLVDRMRAKELKILSHPAIQYTHESTLKSPKALVESEPSTPLSRMAKNQTRTRRASALERESFNYRALTIELYIEGFIKGLEATGLDRTKLRRETVTAINNLLHISQTLAGQRMQVTTDHFNRSEIRKMARHVDETALMVDEYVQAITEACGMEARH